ncbi:MAG: GAF and ANTAR domain-containing protein [Actinomycetes bacterium]
MDAIQSPPQTPDELAEALTELTNLMLATPSVEHLLDDVARLATGVVTPPAACGITMRRDHQPLTVASSGPLAAHVDEVQYAAGDGPCLEAMITDRAVIVADMAEERRWGSYPAHALGYGVRSSLSLPLNADEESRGAMNLYASTRAAFADGARQRAELFAGQLSVLLTVVVRQTRQVQLSDQLRDALAARTVIDQAVGILMDQERCDADRAFHLLRDASQHQNRKLRDIAADIVTAVGGRPPVPPSPFNEPL